MVEQPLVSLCITCYNQVKYIRGAIQSAFDQTYLPLEIVISDDCSTDGTDKIIEEMIAEYKGPHKVVFNRNATNLFIAKNYEKAFKMARGELLVTGAGDDISLPNRIEQIVEAWFKSGKTATLLMHGWEEIDLFGNVNCIVITPWDVRSLLGAMSAYHRRVIDCFKEFPFVEGVYEDGILSLRALAIGNFVTINKPLGKWRRGSGESTNCGYREKRIRVSFSHLKSCDIFIDNVCKSGLQIEGAFLENVKNVIDWRRRHYSAEYDACAGKFFWTRLSGWLRLTPENGWYISRYQRWFVYGRFVPPLGLGVFIEPVVRLAVKLRLTRLVKWIWRFAKRRIWRP